MKIFLLLTLALSLFAIEHKVLLDVQTGNPKLFEKNLIDRVIGIEAYYAMQGEKVHIAVLISGNAYKFFMKETDDTLYSLNKNFTEVRANLQTKLKLLSSKYDVVFETCEMGMQRRDIQEDQLVNFVSPVYSYTIALIKWQNSGYAYLPVR